MYLHSVHVSCLCVFMTFRDNYSASTETELNIQACVCVCVCVCVCACACVCACVCVLQGDGRHREFSEGNGSERGRSKVQTAGELLLHPLFRDRFWRTSQML